MNIIEYCDKNKILWRPLKLEIVEKNGKKQQLKNLENIFYLN